MSTKGSKTDTPVIGILSQETYTVSRYFPDEQYDAFIAASYVKYLESAGARVIPVWIGQNEEYYRRVVRYTNGILFPGGGTYFTEPEGYGEAAQKIYKLAVETNEKGVYYPVWGTCLGLQVLGFAAVGEDIRIDCSLDDKSIVRAVPLDFVEGFENSKLFSHVPRDVYDILGSQNVTYNNHKYCLTEKVLKERGILSDWKILSTNKDDLNRDFISAMESVKYPIYGVQFHPEKSQFEFGKTNIPHTSEAVQVSQYFADFFVNECRKCTNKFLDNSVMKNALIYNYAPKYTGLNNGSYEQIYVFSKTDFQENQLISNEIDIEAKDTLY